MLRTLPGAFRSPGDLPAQGWYDVTLPTTVAAALDSDVSEGQSLDRFDWWFRCELPAMGDVDATRLRFEGLASLVDVWVDGQAVLGARNMHRAYVVSLPGSPHELVLRCAALAPELGARRARPRWKTALVQAQNLRWFRTTLLGRVSSWNPHSDIVGPWRPCRLEGVCGLDVHELQLVPSWRAGRAVLRLGVRWSLAGDGEVPAATLRVGPCLHSIDGAHLHARGIEVHDIELDGLEPWWPHTHGSPAVYECVLQLQTRRGAVTVDGGCLGFKSFELLQPEGALEVRCNGRPLFLRGACWTAADVRRPDADEKTLHAVLSRVVDAGMNMLRIVGTATYANEAFYAACDRLGILVWQDLMFANMDYPFDDPEFAGEVLAEVHEVLRRLQAHACVAVVCGGSETEQQAAMMGLPEGSWSHPFLDQEMPRLLADLCPASAWVRSSPSGGKLPFHASSGVSHYYGVGAYRRALSDARLAGVRLVAECLGLSNVPSQAVLEASALGASRPHDPAWKTGVPRDAGAGWDFEDVRDHYFPELVRADPRELRIVDPQAYRRWSALVSGELMTRVFAAWRAPASGCQGALVWWLRDLAQGAGWGVLDSNSRPKPVYWALKRCLAPRAVLIDDRGLEGCDFLVLNDCPEAFEGALIVELWQSGRIRTLRAEHALHVEAAGCARLGTVEVFGHFVDINHAYRFGPPSHDTVIARLLDTVGETVSESFHFPQGMSVEPVATLPRLRLAVHGVERRLHLQSDEVLLGVEIDAPGYEPDDDAFHLAPGIERVVRLRPGSGEPRARVHCSAANLRGVMTAREA
jgi:beta-mannosidase